PSTNSRAGEERRWKPDRARARNAARTAGAVPANRLVRGKHVPHQWLQDWRPGSESNRRTRICSPLHDHSATWPVTAERLAAHAWAVPTGTAVRGPKQQTPAWPGSRKPGAGNETRTRDPDLGKVVLYQLSYSRASRQ